MNGTELALDQPSNESYPLLESVSLAGSESFCGDMEDCDINDPFLPQHSKFVCIEMLIISSNVVGPCSEEYYNMRGSPAID